MRKEIELEKLEVERGKFTPDNESLTQGLIDKLVKKGIYPSKKTKTMEKYGYSILDMVKAWGVRWHIYQEPLECPYCNANLKNEECGAPFKREIAISDLVLDRTVDCMCPDCYRSLIDGKQYDREKFKDKGG